ncbi:MAG: hypothetical protein KAH24_06475, partial [Holophagae bacterium]|nr:hypothetical protein [Holophagae bacterium]
MFQKASFFITKLLILAEECQKNPIDPEAQLRYPEDGAFGYACELHSCVMLPNHFQSTPGRSTPMSKTMSKLSFAQGRGADAGALLIVLVLMALSWYLVSGVATAVYDQYETYGNPPKFFGPSGGLNGSQLGHQA